MKKFFVNHGKKLIISMMISVMTVFSAISSFAADPDLSASFSSAIASIQTNVLSYIGLALPVGLAIFGAVIAIQKGIAFVRSLLGR